MRRGDACRRPSASTTGDHNAPVRARGRPYEGVASPHSADTLPLSLTNLTQDPSLTSEPFFALILLGLELPTS